MSSSKVTSSEPGGDTWCYVLHLETNLENPPDRIFWNKENAVAAAWDYFATGFNNVSEIVDKTPCDASSVFALYGERPYRCGKMDTYLDTFAIVSQRKLE